MEAGIARMRENNLPETIIGAIVVAVAVLFIAFAYKRTGTGSLSGYEIQARMPKVDGLPDTPLLSVVGRLEMTQTIHVGRLSTALAAVGATDLEVPGTWDGVRLRAEIGPMVSAKYLVDASRAGAGRDLEIVQMPAVKLEMPADFPLARLAEIVFRSAGSDWWEARRLGEEYATNPAWLFASNILTCSSKEPGNRTSSSSRKLTNSPELTSKPTFRAPATVPPIVFDWGPVFGGVAVGVGDGATPSP